MKLLLLQTDIAWNDPQANLKKACGLIASAGVKFTGEEISGGADIIVLPEMFATGYDVEPSGIAEPNGGGQILEWMKQAALRTGAAVTGSVAVEENGRFYNRMLFVKPDGSVAGYDKRHLFSFAGEEKTYTAGKERVVVEWRGWRILLQVCYDLRFPVFSRQSPREAKRDGLRGGFSEGSGDGFRDGAEYDMIIYVASWAKSRKDVWDALLRARAIENVCYVAGVNRVGSDPSTEYSGGTCLVDYKGREVATTTEAREEAVVAEVNLETLRDFRRKFPVLGDADGFALEI